MSHSHDEIFLVSACLIGLCTRYDGRSKPSPDCIKYLAGHRWVPVCPEQLGGLPTPRTAADLAGGDGSDVLNGTASIIDRQGRDLTSQFVRGAQQCLAIAEAQKIKTALLKARSPSCGVTPTQGVTAAMLAANGIKVIEFT